MEYIDFYNGIPIVESNMFIIKSNIPKKKAKTKRIQKKWTKRYGYKNIPDPKVYYFDNKIIGHPLIIKKIIKAMQEV